MSSNRIPTTVICSACGEKVAARTSREKVVSWPLSNSGKGTMTDPQKIERTCVYVCRECFRASREPQRESLFS